MFRLTLKELLAKKLRLLTTALAVMLGVAFMAGTLVLTDTMNRRSTACCRTPTRAPTPSSAAIRARRQHRAAPRIDDPSSTTVAKAAGVAGIEGFITGYAQLVDHDGKAVGNPGMGAPTMGETWITDDELNPYELREGRSPAAHGEVVIDQNSADTGDFAVGETVTRADERRCERRSRSSASPGSVTPTRPVVHRPCCSPSTTHRRTSRHRQVRQWLVRADAGVTQEDLRRRSPPSCRPTSRCSPGTEITKETQDDVKGGLAFFNTFLLAFAAIALFVGAFIIFNTFSIIVTQRQKEMALLRALGASRKQVIRSVMLEAFVVGPIASVVGLSPASAWRPA